MSALLPAARSLSRDGHTTVTRDRLEIELKGEDLENWNSIAAVVAENNEGQIRCETCTPIKSNQDVCLGAATKFGQKPRAIMCFDGMGSRPEAFMADARAPQIFYVTTPILLPSQAGTLTVRSSPFAALAYAGESLKTQNCIVFGSSDAPMPGQIVDYWSTPDRSGFSDPRLKETRAIYNHVTETAKRLGKTDGETLCHLAGLELARWNAEQLAAVSVSGMRTSAAYLDREGVLTAFKPEATLMNLFNGQAGERIRISSAPRRTKSPLALCCLCCDARTMDGSRAFGRNNVVHTHSISALIPPRAANDQADPNWLGIDRAMKLGAPRTVVMGHSKCGGIIAAVDMELQRRREGKRKSFGRFVDPWLDQAVPVVREVLDAIEKHPDHFSGMSDERMYELVTRRVKIWSAKNVREGTGRPAMACFYHLDGRGTEFLPLADSIADSYRRIVDHEQRLYLPENALSAAPESACALTGEGGPQRPFAWLLEVNAQRPETKKAPQF